MKKIVFYIFQFIFSFTIVSSFVRYLVYFSTLTQILHNLFKLTKKKILFLSKHYEYIKHRSFFVEILLFSVILKYIVKSMIRNFIKKIFVIKLFLI